MRGPIGLLLAAAMLGGCAGFGDLLVPAPSMPSPRPTVVVGDEPAEPTAKSAPVAKEEPVPAP
ncbi:MAG: tetratricopeptide repeat protein, partial [Candidatus Rokuibacteriota bacterium]